MPFVEVPPEILEHIVSFFESGSEDLRSLSLVSKAFRIPSQKRIFPQIEIRTRDVPRALQLHSILLSNPDIAHYIRDISMVLDVQDSDSDDSESYTIENPHPIFAEVLDR